MKNILNYINESSSIKNNDFINIFEENELDNYSNLEDVYEAIFDKIYSVNEGIFSKIGQALKRLGDKAETADKNIEAKINKMSDAAKNAIEKAKKTAGDSWNSIKDVYTNTIAQIDDAVMQSKTIIQDISKRANIKVDELEAKIATIAANAIANGKEKLAQSFTDVKKMTAINTFVGGALMCIKSGMDSEQLLDLMTSAGIK